MRNAILGNDLKFEKCAKYANEMTDDVIHPTQYYIEYINRAILANLQRRPLKLGRLIVLQKTLTDRPQPSQKFATDRQILVTNVKISDANAPVSVAISSPAFTK